MLLPFIIKLQFLKQRNYRYKNFNRWIPAAMAMIAFFLVVVNLPAQSFQILWQGKPVSEAYVQLQITNKSKTFEALSDEKGMVSFGDVVSKGEEIALTIQHLSYATIDTSFIYDDANVSLDLERTSYDLNAITFVSGRINKQRAVSLQPKDFLRLASSFDDPSRLVLKAPGFTGTNDQNNSVSFRGMPSHYYKWQVSGLDIVNPNHLANAGTLQDLASTNGGGVNMVSGQLIGRYQYHLPGSNHAQNTNQLAGVSEMEFADSIPSFLQFSLLGLEAGLGINKKNSHFWIGYRYSFTGLMANFGVDFGGEAISFQDVVANYTYESDKQKINLFGGWGNNSNLFTAQDSVLSFKDLQNIDYFGNTYFSGLSINRKLTSSWLLRGGFAFSGKEAERSSQALTLFEDASQFSLQQNMVSSYLDFSARNKPSFGLVFSSTNIDMEYLRTGELAQISRMQAVSNTTARVYGGYERQFTGQWSLNLLTPLDIHVLNSATTLAFNPKLQVRKFFQPGYSISASIYRNSTALLPPFEAAISKSNNVEINAEKILPQGQIGLTAFYHDFFNTNNSLDETYSYNGGLPLFNTGGQSKGVSVYFTKASNNGFWYDVNGSLLTIENQEGKPALGNIVKSMNVQAGRAFKLKKNNLSIAASLIARDGQLSYVLDEKGSPGLDGVQKRSKPYIRVDFRVNYTMRRSVLSFDIQNLLNRVNQGAINYDPFLNQNTFVNQLGTFPLVSYRYFFVRK